MHQWQPLYVLMPVHRYHDNTEGIIRKSYRHGIAARPGSARVFVASAVLRANSSPPRSKAPVRHQHLSVLARAEERQYTRPLEARDHGISSSKRPF